MNSANLGPYGDAIETELIPAIEKQFRGIGQGWARFVYGGSTGGWEAMAVQMFYPDHYNGAFIACPDPVDFRAYTMINIYEDTNAFYLQGTHTRDPAAGGAQLPGPDAGDGAEQEPVRARARLARAARASSSTSGRPSSARRRRWLSEADFRQADRRNRSIGGGVLEGALRPERDPAARLGNAWAEAQGKLRIYVGSADNYFLNNAVYHLEDFLKTTKDPPYEGEVKYGERAEHCWNGDPNLPNELSRLHYHTMYLPTILDRIEKTAPKGADLEGVADDWVHRSIGP